MLAADSNGLDPSIVAAIIIAAVSIVVFALGVWIASRSRKRVVIRNLRTVEKKAVKYFIINKGNETHYVARSFVTVRVIGLKFWRIIPEKRKPVGGPAKNRALKANRSLEDAYNLTELAKHLEIGGRWVLLRARVRLEVGSTSRSRLILRRLPDPAAEE